LTTRGRVYRKGPKVKENMRTRSTNYLKVFCYDELAPAGLRLEQEFFPFDEHDDASGKRAATQAAGVAARMRIEGQKPRISVLRAVPWFFLPSILPIEAE